MPRRVPTIAFTKLKPLATGLALLTLSGCATFSKDGGLDSVSTLAQQRTGQAVTRISPSVANTEMDAASMELLAQPLTADSAVRLAFLNNKSLQASLSQLGASEADLVQAGRIGNPRLGFGRLRGGDNVEIDRSVMFNLVGLLIMPIRSGIEERRFTQAKLQAAATAVELAADTRRAFFNAVAARQSVEFLKNVKTSAEASAELAQRMAKIGNFSALDYQRHQAFYADATAQLARAQYNMTATQEQLIRTLGLGARKLQFKLPDRLPDLPKLPVEIQDAEKLAMQQRLDVQIAKSETEAVASALGLTKASRFINVLEVGYQNKSETGASRANGYEVELVLPIFDWGGAATRRAESQYMTVLNNTADIGQRAQSEVRQAYSAYRTTYDLARHYRDEVVPLRKKISDEVLLRYNGMLMSVFELLADAREQTGSVNAAIEAQRDYWIAETALQTAINGSGSSASASTSMRTDNASAAGGAQH